MWWVGCCSRAGRGRGGGGGAHRLYCVYALLVVTLYVLQQAMYAYQVRSDLDKLSQVMFVMLCFTTCVVKQIVFQLKAEQIEGLIGSLDEPLFNQQCAESEALLSERARGAARFLRVFAGCAVSTCVLWCVFPVLYRLQERHFEFPFWTPFSYDHALLFSVLLLYSFYVTCLVGLTQTAMDAFMATILDQCKIQLQILRNNFETLPERAAALSRDLEEDYEATLHRLLVDCLLHYQKIIETCDTLNDIFQVPLLVQMGVCAWILCMAAYEMVNLNVLSMEFMSTTLFITCILMELLLFCYYGTEATAESERVGEAIYSMKWFETPVWFQRQLVVGLERAKRPLRPTAGLILPLSLDTFVTILKSSYSFYAVLRQTKEAKP